MINQTMRGSFGRSFIERVEVSGWKNSWFFQFLGNGHTYRSPVWKAKTKHEESIVVGQLQGDWFADIRGMSLPNLDWVTSQGVTMRPPTVSESRLPWWTGEMETLEKQAPWFHHCYRDFYFVSGRHLLLSQSSFTRYAGTIDVEEKIWRRSHVNAEELRLLIDGDASTPPAGTTLQLHGGISYVVTDKDEPIRYLDNSLISVELQPDISAPGRCVIAEQVQTISIRVTIHDSREAKRVTIAGIAQQTENKRFTGSRSFEVAMRTEECGILPLLVIAEGEDWIAWRSYKILAVGSLIQSSDDRFNGTVVESVRSMLMRRVYDVILEEEPRGVVQYPYVFHTRFLGIANFELLGLTEIAMDTLRPYETMLKKDGYLDQHYLVDGRSCETDYPEGRDKVVSEDITAGRGKHKRLDTPLFQSIMGWMGNDGVGFYLFQLGKLILRHPSMRTDYEAVTKAVFHLERSTHWNGLLDGYSESEDWIMSEHTSGGPYTQGICIAGLRIMSEALQLQGALSLSARCDRLSRRLIAGLRSLYMKDGYFADRSLTGFTTGMILEEDADVTPSGDLFNSASLSTFTSLCPGTFLLDPEVRVDSMSELCSNTVEQVKKRCLAKGHNLVLFDPYSACLAYCQFTMIANLINLGRLEEASAFLDESLNYYDTTTMKYILPEIVYVTNRDYYGLEQTSMEDKARQLRADFPWLFADGQPTEGVFGLAKDNGNLIHIGYYLYVVDLIVGISQIDNVICIAPKLLPNWSSLTVSKYHTSFGEIGYEAKREGKAVVLSLTKPEGEMVLVTSGLGMPLSTVHLNGDRLRPRRWTGIFGIDEAFDLPTTHANVRLRIGD